MHSKLKNIIMLSQLEIGIGGVLSIFISKNKRIPIDYSNEMNSDKSLCNIHPGYPFFRKATSDADVGP